MKGPTIVGPNLHGPARMLDLDGNGKLSGSELALAVVLGGATIVGSVFLGAVLVLAFCG